MENKIISRNETKVSIGLPLYNAEKYIHKKLDSLLSQTFTNFELIISDNGSTDLTSKICEEYAKKDKRIIYLKQGKNIGAWNNFNFVLQQAKNEFFLWTAADDDILPEFIEENIKIIKLNKKIACTSTKMKLFGKNTSELEINLSDSKIQKKKKKFVKKFGHMNTYPASGKYEERIKEYIKNMRHNQIFYGVFRTEQIKKSFVTDAILGQDACTILNILKFGEIFVIEKTLLNVGDGGVSRSGMIGLTKGLEYNLFETIFPMYPFTKWCVKNLGHIICIKNLSFFVKMNFLAEISLIIDIIRKIKKYL